MRFVLVDRILELEPGSRITTVKNLTLSEEYLDDHFPRFPVMPGVLMLEAMTQASAWLIRVTEDFAHSIVVLKEARNVKYGKFVRPGQALTISAEMRKHGPHDSQLDVQGVVDGVVAVSGKLVLERFNLASRHPSQAPTDEEVIGKMRAQFALIYPTVQQPTPA